ncbi:MAG: c-type cytochrome [Longimicrobiales bacterium]
MRATGWCALVVLAACVAENDAPGTAGNDADNGAIVAAETPPERFAFGTAADSAVIAAMDIDVRPDGVGLPPGSGTVEEGALVYQQRCQACHGSGGQDGPYDRLVGTEPWEDFPASRTVGNYWPYATTLYDYIERAMPLDAPGSLTADETYSVIAYLLHENEIVPPDAVMDATTLPAVQMPARDRFVPDDRTGGPVIR